MWLWTGTGLRGGLLKAESKALFVCVTPGEIAWPDLAQAEACLISQLSTVPLKTKPGSGLCYSKPLDVPTHEGIALVSQPKQQLSV